VLSRLIVRLNAQASSQEALCSQDITSQKELSSAETKGVQRTKPPVEKEAQYLSVQRRPRERFSSSDQTKLNVRQRQRPVREVTLDGPFSDRTLLAGADGMTLVDGVAYVAFTSKIVRVTPTAADWSQAKTAALDVPSGMTDVVSTPAGLYLLNGQSVRFALGDSPDPFALAHFVGTF
jgi:hypothetical protein